MELKYENKKTNKEILECSKIAKLIHMTGNNNSKNKIILGENLEVLKSLLSVSRLSSKIKLVYIDPPFATNNTFRIGEERTSTISHCKSDSIAYEDKLVGADFIEFIRERLILIRELLSDDGSIYLHIDYKIGHYVKVIMDEVFGTENFKNDIARIKCNPKNFQRRAFGNIKDMVLFYTKTDKYTWNTPKEQLTDTEKNILYKKKDSDGRKYTTVPLHAPGETKNGPTGGPWRGILPPRGRHWRSAPEELEVLDKSGLIEWSKNGVPRKKIYSDERTSKSIQDIWTFKDPQNPIYPTEKNHAMLKLIIDTSSNPGDIVLDCFAGSGTTIFVAEQLQRNWIAVDKSEHAIKTILNRMENKQNLIKANFEFMIQDKMVDKYCYRIEVKDNSEFLVKELKKKTSFKKRISKKCKTNRQKDKSKAKKYKNRRFN